MQYSRKDDGICLEGLKKNRKTSVRIAGNPNKIRKRNLPEKRCAASNCSVFGTQLKAQKGITIAVTTSQMFAEHYVTLVIG
jgi:hypothetical protein